VTLLRLVAMQVMPIGAHQQSLWSGAGAGDERAHRALARVQTLLGHGSVVTAVVDGGRAPAERTRLVPWGDETPTAPAVDHARPPWPGHIPAPAPSVLIDPPRPVQVLDAAGQPVTITARGAVPTAPTRLALGSGAPVAITAWAGPWPVDDSWWNHARSRPRPVDAVNLVNPIDPVNPVNPASPVTGTSSPALRRRARFQLVDVHGRAYLVTCAVPLVLPAVVGDTTAVADADDCSPRWTLDALYD
jgi:protein ImuB